MQLFGVASDQGRWRGGQRAAERGRGRAAGLQLCCRSASARALVAGGIALLLSLLSSWPASARTVHRASSTAYGVGCGGGYTTASGYRVRFGQVAHNGLRFGTKIRLLRPRSIRGRRHFYVRDRGGAAMQLDFWMPSCRMAVLWGRRTVAFEVVR